MTLLDNKAHLAMSFSAPIIIIASQEAGQSEVADGEPNDDDSGGEPNDATAQASFNLVHLMLTQLFNFNDLPSGCLLSARPEAPAGKSHGAAAGSTCHREQAEEETPTDDDVLDVSSAHASPEKKDEEDDDENDKRKGTYKERIM